MAEIQCPFNRHEDHLFLFFTLKCFNKWLGRDSLEGGGGGMSAQLEEKSHEKHFLLKTFQLRNGNSGSFCKKLCSSEDQKLE